MDSIICMGPTIIKGVRSLHRMSLANLRMILEDAPAGSEMNLSLASFVKAYCSPRVKGKKESSLFACPLPFTLSNIGVGVGRPFII